MIAARVLLVAALCLVAAPAPAQAGDRRLMVIFVNMTPDAQSTEASKQCVKAIERRIAADYTESKRLGETAMRAHVGKTAGEPMMSWPLGAFDAARATGKVHGDAIILVDCRPEARTLDAVIAPAAHGLARLQLRRVPLDAAAITLASEAILRRAWSDFSPANIPGSR